MNEHWDTSSDRDPIQRPEWYEDTGSLWDAAYWPGFTREMIDRLKHVADLWSIPANKAISELPTLFSAFAGSLDDLIIRLQELIEQYGDVFTMRLVPAKQRVLMLGPRLCTRRAYTTERATTYPAQPHMWGRYNPATVPRIRSSTR